MGDRRNGRIRELDFMRAFAILGVVAIHAGSYSEAIVGPSVIPLATEYIAHLSDFAVPLFFIISGFLLASRPLERKDWGTFYRRRLMTVVPPYLFFSGVYLTYNYWVLGQTDLVQAAWSILLFDAVGVFWFLGAMIQMYLLFPFLSAWLDRLSARRQEWKLPVYAGVLYVAWYAVLAVAGYGANEIVTPTGDIGSRLVGFLFPGYLLFFAIGMYIARAPSAASRGISELGRTPMAAVMLVAPVGLLLLDDSWFLWSMAVVPYTILASALVYRASARLAARAGPAPRSMEVVGKYSFGIYMAHILALAIAANRLWAIGLNAGDVSFYLLLYVMAIAISMVGLFLLNLLPYGTLVSGVRTKDGKRQKLLWWKNEEDNAVRPS